MIRAIETLARIPPFADLPEAELQRLDTRCAWRRARAVGYILDHAEGGVDGYFVARGRARVTIQAIPGKQSILSVLGDGEYFGELAGIDGKPRSAAIVAVTDRVVAKMPPAAARVSRRREAVTRELAALAREGRIDKRKGAIVVIDGERLARDGERARKG